MNILVLPTLTQLVYAFLNGSESDDSTHSPVTHGIAVLSCLLYFSPLPAASSGRSCCCSDSHSLKCSSNQNTVMYKAENILFNDMRNAQMHSEIALA